MVKSGFVALIIVLLVLAGLGYFVYSNYSKIPNNQTLETVKKIPRYPNSGNWKEKNKKNVCFLATNGCDQPVVITFTTKNSWGQVYTYYVDYLTKLNWKTNSQIYTSTPTNVLFTKDKCTLSMINVIEKKYIEITTVCKAS